MAQSEIEVSTRKIISKQSTRQLQSKLEKGTLLGLSKKITLEVLEKRGVGTEEAVEVKKTKTLPKKEKEELKAPEGKGWSKNGSIKKTINTPTPKVEEKEGGVKKESGSSSKSDVIRGLAREGKTILEISKTDIVKELNLSYQFIRGVVKKMNEDEKSK